MVKIHYDPLVFDTFQRLFGANAFRDVLDKAIPEIEWQEREALRRLAKEQDWDFSDFAGEGDVLDAKFRHWVPTLASYSVIIVLQSVVETQLLACAERVGQACGSRFRVKDVQGRGLEQGAIYLERVAALEIKKYPGWDRLQDLQELRNIIVHRGGQQGESHDQQRSVQRLLQRYDGKLSLSTSAAAADGQILISMHLCTDFAREVEAFFRWLFRAAGLPQKGMWVES